MRRMANRVMIPVIVMGLLMIPGCFAVVVDDDPWAPEGHWGTQHYYYYPDSGVYYDRTRNYYYFQDGGYWRESPSLPPGYHVDRDHHRELRLDTDKPYKYHSDVNKKYPPGQWKKKDKD